MQRKPADVMLAVSVRAVPAGRKGTCGSSDLLIVMWFEKGGLAAPCFPGQQALFGASVFRSGSECHIKTCFFQFFYLYLPHGNTCLIV